jgi:hypothetical protein
MMPDLDILLLGRGDIDTFMSSSAAVRDATIAATERFDRRAGVLPGMGKPPAASALRKLLRRLLAKLRARL